MDRWEIFNQAMKPGEKRELSLSIPVGGLENQGAVMPGEKKTEGYEMPVILINGAKPGKTLLVTAGMHAGEYNGTPAVIQVGKGLDPSKLCGRLILIPCVNTSGFWTMHPRVTPEDHFNFNGQYPGNPEGTVGERIADFFVKQIFPQVDFILDLHGGSRGERMTPLVFFPTHPKVRGAALSAAKALNIEFLIESQATLGEYSYAAARMDIPGLLIERGDGYFCDPALVEANKRDLLLLMDHLGIAPAPEGMRNEGIQRRVFREAIYLESDFNGLWYPEVSTNHPIKRGEVLGKLEDMFGNPIATIKAECDGHALYVNCGLAVPKGELLVACAVAASEEDISGQNVTAQSTTSP